MFLFQRMAAKRNQRYLHTHKLRTTSRALPSVRETCQIPSQSGDQAHGVWLPATSCGVTDDGEFEWVLWSWEVERWTEYKRAMKLVRYCFEILFVSFFFDCKEFWWRQYSLAETSGRMSLLSSTFPPNDILSTQRRVSVPFIDTSL